MNSKINLESNITENILKRISWEFRLTLKYLIAMKIDTEFLSNTKKQLFIDILFKYESVIIFNDSEMSLLWLEIESLVIIHIISHISW